jgi:hypothetical protein
VLSGRSNNNPCLRVALGKLTHTETKCTEETKLGFLSGQLDNGVLNFLTECSPNGIRSFWTAGYRAVEQLTNA